jgi:CDP-diacylglycerol--glycerol-3-phosphate 3-phosphatidyltransferase
MSERTRDQGAVLSRLRQGWAHFAVLSLLFLASGYALLSTAWGFAYALRWLVIASAGSAYLLTVSWRHLGANHRQGETELLPTLGWGNRLTLARGMLTAGLLGFIGSPLPPGWLAWVPGILYTLVCIADFLDGYLARRTNQVTLLGDKLDMSFDGMGVLGAVLLAVGYGRVPGWYLFVGLARYAFLAGLWIRRRQGRAIHELPPSIGRRVIAGLQMGFLAVMLWPLFSPPGTHIAAALFGLPLLVGFLLDWLSISGKHPLRNIQSVQKAATPLVRWLPLALRAVILALGLPMLADRYRSFADLHPEILLLTLLETITIIFLALGAAGRVAAILGLMLLGAHQSFVPLSPPQISLAIAYVTILFMGSGAFSLWSPEDNLVYRRAGERAGGPGEISNELSMEPRT